MPAPVIECSPCKCCRDLVELIGEIKIDHDLGGVVCVPCSYNLRGASAWLRQSGLPQCIPPGFYNWHR